MIERRRGCIINVASVAAFVEVGGGPGYSASKAYLVYYSTNLAALVQKRGVYVQALCPGYTRTEFHNSRDYQGNEHETLPGWAWMTSGQVVRYSLRRRHSRQVVVVPGFRYRVIVALLRSSIGRTVASLKPLVFKK